MARIDQALLEPSHYPYSCELETRFADLDAQKHINNVAFVELMQEARVRFHAASGYHAAIGTGYGTVVARLEIDYLGQSFFPDPMTVHVGFFAIGRSSYTLTQLARQRGATVGFARVVMVCLQAGKPAPFPVTLMPNLDQWTMRQ